MSKVENTMFELSLPKYPHLLLPEFHFSGLSSGSAGMGSPGDGRWGGYVLW